MNLETRGEKQPGPVVEGSLARRAGSAPRARLIAASGVRPGRQRLHLSSAFEAERISVFRRD